MELTDEVLETFLRYQLLVREYTEFMDAVKEAAKKRGSFCTRNHACVVQDRVRETLGPVDLMEELVPRKILEDWGVLKMTPFKIVIIGTIQNRPPPDFEALNW